MNQVVRTRRMTEIDKLRTRLAGRWNRKVSRANAVDAAVVHLLAALECPSANELERITRRPPPHNSKGAAA